MPMPHQVVIEQLFQNAIKKCLAGESQASILEYFTSYDIQKADALALTSQVFSAVNAMPKPKLRLNGLKKLVLGFGCLLLAIAINAISKSMSSLMIIPSGLALFGVAMMLNGHWKMVFGKDLVKYI